MKPKSHKEQDIKSCCNCLFAGTQPNLPFYLMCYKNDSDIKIEASYIFEGDKLDEWWHPRVVNDTDICKCWKEN